jgi:hypothetical protein
MKNLTRPWQLVLCLAMLTSVGALAIGCGKKSSSAPPVATPSVSLNHDRAPAGSPLEITYKFIVGSNANFAENDRVMVHVVDTDEELMWTDDHDPPTPTSQWKPGQTVEYTRTVFIPIFPYVGDASIQLGLYSTKDQKRVPLVGQDAGQLAYTVGKVQLTPQTDNLFSVFKEGWHPAETAEKNNAVEWQWTKKEATLAFKNPKKDSLFYLDADSPGGSLHGEQQVQVMLGGQQVDQFTVKPDTDRLLRKIKLPAGQMGGEEMSELHIVVDKTFVPAEVSGANSKDPRELGVRVFHAYVDPR